MNLARPYALAAFEYAQEHDQIPAWQAFLESASLIACDPSVHSLLTQPKVTDEMLFTLFQGILTELSDQARSNFLRLLKQYRRFSLLPEIATLFNAYYAALEKISPIRVVTAVPMADHLKEKLSQALSKRLKHSVSMQYEIDPSLIGGAIIYLQDRAIDSSIRGKLNRLLQNMIA